MICRAPNGQFTDVNIEACRPALLTTIDKIKPNVIIMLGNAPIRSLMPGERGGAVGSMERWVGFQIPSLQHKAWLCPTYAPKDILKAGDRSILPLIWKRHLKAAYALRKKKPKAVRVEKLHEQIELIMSPRQARARLKDLSKKSGRVAFDYETTGLKPEDLPHRKHKILSCSFSFEGEDTFAYLMNNEKTARMTSRVLQSPKLKKVASNLKFEERWTMAKMGHKVANWHWDTMLASHVLDNRHGITSVKFQAFQYFGVPDYDRFVNPYKKSDQEGFNTLHTMDPKDLLLYNELDALLEFMVMEKQQEELPCPE